MYQSKSKHVRNFNAVVQVHDLVTVDQFEFSFPYHVPVQLDIASAIFSYHWARAETAHSHGCPSCSRLHFQVNVFPLYLPCYSSFNVGKQRKNTIT